MESYITYSIAAIVALAFGYFIYTRVTSKKNQSNGAGGRGKYDGKNRP